MKKKFAFLQEEVLSRITALIMLFVLAAIGLIALIYPEIRQELIQVLGGVLTEGQKLIRG